MTAIVYYHNIVIICFDIGAAETIDPHVIAREMLALGADRDDELLTYFAGERTEMAGRLGDLICSKHLLLRHTGASEAVGEGLGSAKTSSSFSNKASFEAH